MLKGIKKLNVSVQKILEIKNSNSVKNTFYWMCFHHKIKQRHWNKWNNNGLID